MRAEGAAEGGGDGSAACSSFPAVAVPVFAERPKDFGGESRASATELREVGNQVLSTVWIDARCSAFVSGASDAFGAAVELEALSTGGVACAMGVTAGRAGAAFRARASSRDVRPGTVTLFSTGGDSGITELPSTKAYRFGLRGMGVGRP
jgi:hypothetical protein